MMYRGNGTPSPACCLRGSPSHRGLRLEAPEQSSSERNFDRNTRPVGHRSHQQSTRDIQAHPTEALLAPDNRTHRPDNQVRNYIPSMPFDTWDRYIISALTRDSHKNGRINDPASSNQFSESPLQYPGYLFVTNNRPPTKMTLAH